MTASARECDCPLVGLITCVHFAGSTVALYRMLLGAPATWPDFFHVCTDECRAGHTPQDSFYEDRALANAAFDAAVERLLSEVAL